MFYREGAGFAVEEVRQYGPNVLYIISAEFNRHFLLRRVLTAV